MGLPLWTAPQDPKPPAQSQEKDVARARSTIRRQRTIRERSTNHFTEQVRAARRMRDSQNAQPETASSQQSTAAHDEQSSETARRPLSAPRRALHGFESIGTLGGNSIWSDAVEGPEVYVFSRSLRRVGETPRVNAPSAGDDGGPHVSSLRPTASTLRALREDGNGDAVLPPLLDHVRPVSPLPPFSAGFAPAQQYNNGANRSWLTPRSIEGAAEIDESSEHGRALRRFGRQTIADTMANYPEGRARRSRRRRRQFLDGLGDRDRSISPDGEGAWSTLLTTITPDPRAPSVGSSFATSTVNDSASTSVSAGTSMTSADTSPAESNPCDHDMDNPSAVSDYEAEAVEIDDLGRILPLNNSGATSRSEWNDDEVMRMVRSLAARPDIPDGFWAAAGLSRASPAGHEAPI